MPSGGKELVFNTRERAVSSDNNRAQAFADADRGELLRWLMNVRQGSDDLGIDMGGGIDVGASVLTSPVSGEIAGGLCVRPQVASLNLIVDPGVAHVIAPDADADASNYKFVDDPGIQSLGVLTMTLNASGSTRVDVIEVQYVNNVVESANRDIYDQTTGLFTPTVVTKARQGALNYRVRLGTPGAGFPGTALGWMPLCVAVVPNGGANNDATTFYDVRPLVSDRPVPPFNLAKVAPRVTRSDFYLDDNGGGGAFLIGDVETSGVVDATGPAAIACRLGGIFTFGGVATGPDLSTAEFQSGGAPANGLAYVYLACPFGLPRWMKYTPASAGTRLPFGVRGLPMISNVGPAGPLGPGPSAPLPLPAGTGLGGTTSAAVCIGATTVVAGLISNVTSDGRFLVQGDIAGYSSANGTIASPDISWTFTPNGTRANLGYPASAKSLRVTFEISFAALPGNALLANLLMFAANAGLTDTFWTMFLGSQNFDNASGGTLGYVYTFTLDIPVPLNAGASWKLQFVPGSFAGGTVTAALATINAVALS